ncbi:MAG TPA: branched-chain amino acid ABC transporter substrate-binding protein [Gaiellaceae bacterium]|jgi:branched-chain amino acid transport system substrate-binding protein|nr:branched-chain amino acid ABC transporter substrate-binding protein [Gaiellaceae bacterium]
MLKRVGALAVIATAFAVAVSTTAWGSSKAPAKSAAATKTVNCGKVRTIGIAAPLTGPASSIGVQQLHWAQYFVKRWNKAKANKNQQIKLIQGDTQLGVDTAFAVKVANSFSSNSKVLAVVGPAGSQEVVASTKTYKGGGLAWVSGSATRTTLTDGHTDGNRIGYFFRVVPNDSVQGPTVANYMINKLKWKRVYIIDDQETYSQGLADGVQKILQNKGVSVTRNSISQTASDFSSVIAKIPGNTQGVYIPWQLAPQAQAFGQQLKAAGKSSIKLFGSDGLFSPDWKIGGSYDSFFPVNTNDPVVKAFANAHGGDGQYFGAPSYVAAQVEANAITSACKAGHGKTSRAAVRKLIAKTKLKSSILGFGVSFSKGGDLKGGGFGVYQIQSNGSFKRIG